VTNVLPEHVISSLRERRKRMPKSDCQRERVSSTLVMSQLNGSSQLLGIDFKVLARAKQDRAHKAAWEDFKEVCKQVLKAAPAGSPDPREQMILFIKDMKP
jgi:hypothetical protein